MVIRLGRPLWWMISSVIVLAVFALRQPWLHPVVGAGRVYAAYGGVYIVASLAWLWAVEKPCRPWNILGAAVCLAGAVIIYFGPRTDVTKSPVSCGGRLEGRSG